MDRRNVISTLRLSVPIFHSSTRTVLHSWLAGYTTYIPISTGNVAIINCTEEAIKTLISSCKNTLGVKVWPRVESYQNVDKVVVGNNM